MAFNGLKSSTRPEFSRHLKLSSYLLFLVIELAIIHQVSDLPVSIGIWLSKAEQLASFQVPSDNFYGPGAALMLVPFLWLSNQLFLVVLFYFVVGTIGYWKITNLIEPNRRTSTCTMHESHPRGAFFVFVNRKVYQLAIFCKCRFFYNVKAKKSK